MVLLIVTPLVCELSGRNVLKRQLRRAAQVGIEAPAAVSAECSSFPAMCAASETAVRGCAARLHHWQRQNQADEHYRELPLLGGAKLPRPGVGLTGGERAAIKVFLVDNEEIIENVRQLALRGEMKDSTATRSSREVDAVVDDPLLRNGLLLRALGLAALFAADGHDSACACESIRAMVELNGTLHPRNLFAETAALASERLIMDVAQWTTSIGAFREAELHCLQDAARRASVRYDGRQTIRNVLSARCQSVFAAQRELRKAAWQHGDGLLYIFTPGWVHYDIAQAIARCVADAEGISLPPGEALGWYRAREASWAPGPWSTPVANCSAIVRVGPALRRMLETTALCRVTEAGLAAMRYRAACGEYPVALASLVPVFLGQVPTDPFDGQSLRYECGSERGRVWSIGADAVDDGGVDEVKTDDGRVGSDIVLHLCDGAQVHTPVSECPAPPARPPVK